MKLTPEQIADNAAAVTAFLNGMPVQYKKIGAEDWKTHPNPAWVFLDYFYRPAPIPEPHKPWDSPEDVPGPVCWVRYSGQNTHCALVLAIDPKGVWSFDTDMEERLLSWDDCARHEHSTDRKTWKPCVKIV